MKRAIRTIHEAIEKHPNACIAFSGGGDSLVLIDVIYRRAKLKIPILAGPYNMQPPGTRKYNNAVAREYGADIHHTPNADVPVEIQWRLFGWPMLGKLNSREWTAKNPNAGFKLDCTRCCKTNIIDPKRNEARRLGFNMLFTGMRDSEARIRGKHSMQRNHKSAYWIKTSKVWQSNPLEHWTDLMIKRYTKQEQLKTHPAKTRGAQSIGCILCGGGAQFTGSTFPICRRLWPEEWRKFIVDQRGGLVILAIKHQRNLTDVRSAVDTIGGLAHLADTRPWIFDYLTYPPKKGYVK